MRSVSSFTIEHKFHRIAIGMARLTSYDIEYTYPSLETDNPAKLFFHVEPESYPPTNIHVIIGRNNIGKTFLIKHMVSATYDSNSNIEKNGRLVNSRTQAFANILCVSFSPFDNYNELIQLHKNREKEMPFSFIGINNSSNTDFSDKFVRSLIECQGNSKKCNY